VTRPFAVLALLLLGAAPKPRGVTLDVKDEDVHAILKSMQKQCAVKNLVIDPDVSGNGTFYFHDVPCGKAFDVVLSTMGLAAVTYADPKLEVERRR
jgi:type II secretory pathway component HofQ